MTKLVSITFIFIFYGSIVFGQSNINSYKYILVPEQFEFQKSVDQYQVNSLTKFLFNKAGFTVLFTNNQYPLDLVTNRCLALKVVINDNSGIFSTKMNIDLYDCYNNIVLSTKEGRSKEKEFKKAYHEAIRNSFKEIEKLNYEYDSSTKITTKKIMKQHEVVDVSTPTIEKSIIGSEVIEVPAVMEVETALKTKVVVVIPDEEVKIIPKKTLEKPSVNSLIGKFNFDNWGESTISKKGDGYSAVGGDEKFEFATIYKTSKPTLFIIKWVAFKKPQLLEIDSNGNLNVDTENGVNTYQRVD